LKHKTMKLLDDFKFNLNGQGVTKPRISIKRNTILSDFLSPEKVTYTKLTSFSKLQFFNEKVNYIWHFAKIGVVVNFIIQ
jgi:hypothetical protein